MEPESPFDDAAVLAEVIAAFRRLDPAARERVYETIGIFFQLKKPEPLSETRPAPAPTSFTTAPRPKFSADMAPSPKQFLMEKDSHTDVERVACLAYYLQQYRDQPNFSTLDISKLNTDAAQRKFANAAWSVTNAIKMGYLVPADRGTKQLSAAQSGLRSSTTRAESERRLSRSISPPPLRP